MAQPHFRLVTSGLFLALLLVGTCTLGSSRAEAEVPQVESVQACIKAGQKAPSILKVHADSNRDDYHDDVTFIEGGLYVKFPEMPDDCWALVRRQVSVKIRYSTTGNHRFGTTGIHNRVIHDIGGYQAAWIPVCPRPFAEPKDECSDGHKPLTAGFRDDYFHTTRYGRIKWVKAELRIRLLDATTVKGDSRKYFSIRKMNVPTTFEKRNPPH